MDKEEVEKPKEASKTYNETNMYWPSYGGCPYCNPRHYCPCCGRPLDTWYPWYPPYVVTYTTTWSCSCK